MGAIPQAAIAASVIVGLLAVPAASQEAKIIGAATADLPDVSSSEQVPKKVSRTTSASGFSATVRTAFDRFTTSIEPGSANATLETPGSKLRVFRSPEGRRWVLSTPSGTLRMKKSSERTVEKVSTPHGELVMEVEDGSQTTSFSGSNRQKVEKARRELHELLEKKRGELDDRRSRMRERAMPDIEVVVNSSTAASSASSNTPEHAVIVNKEFETVDLEGWKLSDTSTSYEFGDIRVEPGEKLHVYTESDTEVKGTEPAVFDTGISWNDGGDTAVLENANGEEIHRGSY